MSGLVERQIAQRFEEAERARLLLHPETDAERAALRRRIATGEVVRVQRGLYALSARWSALLPHERTARIARSMTALHPT